MISHYSMMYRSSGAGPPTTVSMASFSPSMSSPAGVATPYSHMHHTMSQLTPSYGAGCYQVIIFTGTILNDNDISELGLIPLRRHEVCQHGLVLKPRN